jgi:hypothetical protein
MNNSFSVDLSLESVQETKPTEMLREREAKLIRLIEALLALSKSNEWSTLKAELFDEVLESTERSIRTETAKAEISLPALYRLQGEKKWARNYANPLLLVDQYRAELTNIRTQLSPSGPTE